jgi:hypothetical protein
METNDQSFTLRCKVPNPANPDMLSCQILPNPVPQKEDSAPIEASKTSLPDQPATEPVKPASDVSGDNGSPGYETLTVRKVKKGQKVFLEVLDPGEDPASQTEDSQRIQETTHDSARMQHRLAQSNKCNDKHCPVSRVIASARRQENSTNERTKGRRI